MYVTERDFVRGEEDRRFTLKRATQAAHDRVEAVVHGAGMFASVDGYRRFLAATHEMRARFEGILERNGAALVWALWPARCVAQVVAQDIIDLGGKPFALTENPLRMENVSDRLSPAELLGVLYVLEGSALGARLLVKSAAEMGLSATHGARHLHAQANDREAWRSFLALIADADTPPCAAAARATFEAFADAYQRAAA